MGIFDGLQKIGKDVNNQLDWRKVNILGGDLATGKWDFNGGMMTPDPSTGLIECVSLYGEIEKLTVQTDETAKDWMKKLGVAAGYLKGGSGKEVCVLVELTDGRKFLAQVDARIHQQMVAFIRM